MTRWKIVWFGVAAALSWPAAATDTTPEIYGAKYQAIFQRNAFNLHEPPPPPKVEPPPPQINVKLAGITTFPSKKALLVVKVANKPDDTPVMKEGEREGDVEVLAIDNAAGTVRIRSNGMEATLSLEKDGIEAAAAPVVAANPGMPVAPGMPAPVSANHYAALPVNPATAAYQGYVPPSTTASGSRSRLGVSVGGGGMPGIPTGVSAPAATVGIGGQAVSLAPGVINTSGGYTVPHPPAPKITAAESTILVEVEKMVHSKAIKAGDYPPLPPTEHNPNVYGAE